ncbi:beta-ketoacyl-ACP synthase III [Clostridium perfringens]|uniref:Beta-ketoacyl-[acyl-carrier-protein] synthase III n=3 Tax=Clostridium perfringens TaxID=1502 RepID=FABH_CLOPE|nr:beta-ketoacyl-ACP synthase III [Clostridium perfringens]Q8XLH3.1 RecName: Full=Beta-ketoacyl-[acyl-carrier-protein] synthase III; Short=Beta-ketoacyl-ACP synthase III; Short=KAS III; AltName: Full=3-oxoacyl-[acyl-carrier-protein] synthase 3; AltName: Full=3-oxoacyl-[acyl-carrier-protein] synthase III [Clostridium perfringens str. 13]STB12089.1 3-oxoacyl-ACP synthase [Clostridium novyi]ALG48662.1 3-oxoacyl-(acyl-carrier-protein) synthase, KASIII [Clostridium perfringens]AMN32680.1 3-oxoacyl-A
MKNAKMIGFGLYTPKNLVENERLQEFLETSDEWIRTRTGIERRYISLDENTSDLAVEASKKALSQARLSAEEIDLIIVATVTPDNFTPSTACIVQDKLGAKNAWAFDINAACTGFIYALKLGRSLIRSGEANNALIIGAETLSKALNWEDRGSCVLFGDGAGATVLTSTEEDCGIKCVNVKSDGSKGDSLVIQGLPLNSPFKDGREVSENYINMNGREIFKFATKVMEESIVEILEKENIKIEDIAAIIPHQANLRIIDYVVKRLGIPREKFITNLQNYGNTSGASIPIALCESIDEGNLKKGDNIIMVGFGGGLTWGAALIKL